jgi:N-acetylglucosaminyldiphosphoundecaprenol N-acetyl-beta-D-mannosaminyltransferase
MSASLANLNTMPMPGASVPSFRVLGVSVQAVQIPDVIGLVEGWIRERSQPRYITFTGMHGMVESLHDPEFRRILNQSLVVPDGMPLVWLGRRHGHSLARRVYGPELMESFCRLTGNRDRHFFYGGAPGVAEQVARTLAKRFGIRVAGTYSPPFRPLTTDESNQVAAVINAASPDLLWVGLSTPKQECWMHEFRDRLNVPVLLGVGAAFDFVTGRVSQAPRWMREHGLEWSFRLVVEPRRLWRRYLVYGSEFLWNASLEMLRLKTFEECVRPPESLGIGNGSVR